TAAPILEVRELTLQYARRRLLGTKLPATTALQNVTLELYPGKTLALVGASGSGKSSLARCLLGLEQPSAGQILFEGADLLSKDRGGLRAARRQIHLIFQDSALALNPRLTIEEIIGEPL